MSAPVDSVPLGALDPLQLPEAVQFVALVEDHDKVALDPLVMELGDAVKVRDGAIGVTFTVTD